MIKKINPKGPIEGSHRVVRGGSCFSRISHSLRYAWRTSDYEYDRSAHQGVRLVRTNRTKFERILYGKKD